MFVDARNVINVVVSLIVAMAISFAMTPVAKSFAQKVGAIDVPKDARRIHKHPIPRMGGLAIFLGFVLSVVLFADINRQIQGMLLGAVVVVVIGVIDDMIQLKAIVKLVFQILAALIAVYYGIVIDVVSSLNFLGTGQYISLGFMSIPITVFWIVAITNSVNIIDGLDGLAVGVSVISSVVMLVVSLLVADISLAIIIAALVGACLGFMPYNINPAKIFMGDSGSLLLGYVLATVSIIGLFKFYAIVSFVVPFFVLAFPLLDTTFAFFRRIMKGQSPMSPDRGHLHHRLIDMGMSQKQAVAVLYSVSTVLGLVAVVLTTGGVMRVILIMVTFAVAIIVTAFVTKTTYQAIGEKKNGNGNGNGKHEAEESQVNEKD